MFEKKEDCEECEETAAHAGEIAMALCGLVAGLLIVAFSLDLMSGGRISGRLDAIGGKAGEVTADE